MDTNALQKINYGMYIVSSKKGEELNGQIANVAMMISSDPATIAISINKQNLTHEFISESKFFSISILSEEAPMTFVGNYGFKSGRNINKFEGAKYKTGITGVPIVEDYSIGYIESEMIDSIDVFTHTIFIGKVVDAQMLGEGNPMTYDYYHKVKKGFSPKSAPTYIKPV